jgi:UDP-3-O-[3-hydroxymyristoyl] glucosamine N-acyltransferase
VVPLQRRHVILIAVASDGVGMSEPVFSKRGGSLQVREIAALTGARVVSSHHDVRITDIAALDRAGPHDLTFADASSSETMLRGSHAGACFITPALAKSAPAGTAVLIVDNPYVAFVTAAHALFPQSDRPSSLFETQGRAGSALVHATARLEPGVVIDPAAMVGPRAEIGSGTLVGPMAAIGPDVRVGRDCAIGAGASVANALIGDRVTIRAGCRIGEGGFGGGRGDVPRVGRVIIQDGVEIGANSTVDRGTLGDTVIGEGAKIDSLSRIPADMMVERHCAIVAAGSVQRRAPQAEAKDRPR